MIIHFYSSKNYTVLRRSDWVHFMQSYKKIVTKNSVVLEVGGSVKERTEELSEYCKELIVLEKYINRVPNFSKESSIKIIEGDWQNLSSLVEPEKIDIVCSSHVIEHTKDDLKCINESYRILKKGGFLLFNTPNRKRLVRAIIELYRCEKKFPWWEHEREYVQNDLKELINKSGFKNCSYKIQGVSFGCVGGPFTIYSDYIPRIFEKYSSFWEVMIEKN